MKQRILPNWLKIKLPQGETYNKVSNLIESQNLHTVCTQAKCPNRAECFGQGTATFLILGSICTRNCQYCNIATGIPEPIDPEEPQKIAQIVKKLNLDYVVITSVTRDDLSDGGAEHYTKIIYHIKNQNPNTKIEILTPDFQGNIVNLQKVLSSKPQVFNHNIEVVKSLFPNLRAQGDYQLSLNILKEAKNIDSEILTKSGFMLGLGETPLEIISTIKDLHNSQVDILTIGQYIQPRQDLASIQKFYTPDEFLWFSHYAKKIGFKKVISGPLVRSSYKAKSAILN